MRETRKLKRKWSKMIKTSNNHELVKAFSLRIKIDYTMKPTNIV